ncbi:TPA: AAA family ATPase, partial [Salmonella enterica]
MFFNTYPQFPHYKCIKAIAMNSRIIITGGPSAGKTTLITALEKSGFHCQPESGRAVIKQQMDING